MDPALRAWIDLVRAPEPEIDLTLGTLALARVEYPDLVAEHYVKHLDELAARSGTAGIDDPLRALHRLREFLFDEEGFRGNADDYYDPANSCLNRVLERKLGIPISLSVLMMGWGDGWAFACTASDCPATSWSAPRSARSPCCSTRSTAAPCSPRRPRPTSWRARSAGA
jgi:regulator of sirC expression with transglutaminase-like and TPR domain